MNHDKTCVQTGLNGNHPPSLSSHQPYIPSQFPRRSLRKVPPPRDDLDNSCVLSQASVGSLDMLDRRTPVLLLQYEGSTDKSVQELDAESPMLLERVSSTMSSKRSSAGSTKKNVQPKKREGFGAVWASRSSRGSKSTKTAKSPGTLISNNIPQETSPTNESLPRSFTTPSSPVTSGMTSLPVARSDVTSLHADQSDMTSQTTSITDQRDTPLTTSSVQTVVTCPDQLTQPPPVEISGSPIAETCLRPIASRPNSENNRGNRLCDNNNNLTVPDVTTDKSRPNSPSCIPNHLSAPSLVVDPNIQPDNIEIEFKVEPGYTFNPLRIPSPSKNKISFSPEPPKPTQLSRSMSARSPSVNKRSPSPTKQEQKSGFVRSAKGNSFMKMIKKAKGSKKGASPSRSLPTSPTSSKKSTPTKDVSLSSGPDSSPPKKGLPSGEQNLIRIWADQIDGGVEGYKGFLISPDTTARELLATVHSKLNLPGMDKDFFLCAKFFQSSISDRPLMDTDRPLFLHEDWDANENYRFEVRQKPKAIMMVFGDEPLHYSNTSFRRGAAEVSEDATTSRIISELVNKYQLDPCQRYHLMERRPNFDRVLRSTDCPVLLQRKWLPFEDVKFVLGISPSTPEPFGQLAAPSQFSSKVSSSVLQTSNTDFTTVTPYDSQVSQQPQQRLPFDPSSSSIGTIETLGPGEVPDFESADMFNDCDTNSVRSTELPGTFSILPSLEEDLSGHLELGNKKMDARQQKINSGFEEMQNRWMGLQQPPEYNRFIKRSSSGDIKGIEEHLFADLHGLGPSPALDANSFVQSEFLDSSGNPINQTYTSSDFYTPSPRTNKIKDDSPESSYSTDYDKPSLNLTSQSFRLSFGTSNGSDVDSDPEMFITAKSALEQSSCCSDSGVNVSDGSSYRPADHESFEEQDEDLNIPVFNITSPTTDPDNSPGGSTDSERRPPSGYSTPRSKGRSECSTPRKLSVASHGNMLHEMSWDNFDIDRNKFETAEEYEKYIAHVKAEAESKHKSGELIGDYSAVSDSETLPVNNEHSMDETCGSQDITILEDSISTHNEMSDKDNAYETSVEDSDISFPTEADIPADLSFPADHLDIEVASPHSEKEMISPSHSEEEMISPSHSEKEIISPCHSDKGIISPSLIDYEVISPRDSCTTETDGLPMTESLALLAETKQLYNALEEKTSLLEEKYFSPEKMKCALSDPMGSFVLEEEDEIQMAQNSKPSERPAEDVNEPSVPVQRKLFNSDVEVPKESSDLGEEEIDQTAGLISRSIEFFEQLSQSSPSPKKPDERLLKGTPPKTPSKAQKLKKNRRPSKPRSTEEPAEKSSLECPTKQPTLQSANLDQEEIDIPEAIAEVVAPAAQCPKIPPKVLPKPKSPVKLNERTKPHKINESCDKVTDQDTNKVSTASSSSSDGLTKQRLDSIVPRKISRKPHKSGTSLSQPSIETGATEISRTTVSTDSTAILRESVERLRFEIDEIVNDCSESFATSLDTDRHNFSDSTYDRSLQNNSNVMDDTLVSDTGDLLSSESGFSNPVILDEYCSDPEAAASELEELFQSYLPAEPKDRGTVGIEVTYHSDQSDTEDIHYVECEICESPYDDLTPVIEPEEVPDVNSILILSNSSVHNSLENHVNEDLVVVSENESDSLQLVECLSVTSIEEVIPVITTDDLENVNCLPVDVLSDCHSVSSASKYIVEDGGSAVSVQDVESVPDDIEFDGEDFTDILSQDIESPLKENIDDNVIVSVNNSKSAVATDEVGEDTSDDFSDPGNATFVNEDLSLSALSDSRLNDRTEPKLDAFTTEETSYEADSWSTSETSESVRKPLARKPSIVDDLMDRYLSSSEDPKSETEEIDHVPGCENSPEKQDKTEQEHIQSIEVIERVTPVEVLQSCPATDTESLPDTSRDCSDRAEHDGSHSHSSLQHLDSSPDARRIQSSIVPLCPSTEPETETDTVDVDPHTPQPTEHETESESETDLDFSDNRYSSPYTVPKPDNSYGAAYDDLETSESETSESELSEYETLSGNYRHLCSRLEKLKTCFKKDKFNRILDLEQDEATGMTLYEIKLPCIAEEDDCEEIPSDQINKMMPHADLKRQYKNLLAEIEDTKPKLRQLEVLQSELTSMQKAYHDLKEQALRMSIEQDAQKSQIEEEIKKLKISNQDLIKKNKDSKAEAVVSTIMELEKLYSNRITALEKALQQKDEMVQDLEEQRKNMEAQLNVTRRQSVQLETANQLLHKRNEVLVVEKQDGEINPALYFDSDNERLALLAKQCDALQQTVSSLEGTLMLRVKELNETYEDLDTMRSDLRIAEVAKIEAEAQLDVNKREVSRLQNVNEEFAEEIKQKIAENGKLEQENRHLNENIESLQLEYDDCKARVGRLENALLAQEKALEAMKNSEKSAKSELMNLEKNLEVANQDSRKKEEEMRKLKKEVDKAKKGSSMYNLCNVLKPGETLELVSVDLPAVTQQIPRGIYLKEGQHGVYIDKVDANSSAGKTHRLAGGDRVVEINLNDVSNGTFEAVSKDVDSPRAMQLVVARVAPDVRVESKLRAEALKDQIKDLVMDLDKTAKHCQELQVEAADLKDELANVKAKQKSEIGSLSNKKKDEELQNLKALLAQKEQYLKTLETTVRSKNELLVTMEMDHHRTPRSTPNSSLHQNTSFSPGLSSTVREPRTSTSGKSNGSAAKDDSTVSELVNRYGN